MKIGNVLTKAILRSPLHWLISNTTLLIAVSGRKSGCEYTLPVNYVRDGEILYITSTRARTWWRNLRGGLPVRLCLRGRDLAAEGVAVEDCASVSKNLKRFFQIRPQFAKFFDIRLDVNGNPDEQDLFWVARECVIVVIGLQGEKEKTPVSLHRHVIPNIVLHRVGSCF